MPRKHLSTRARRKVGEDNGWLCHLCCFVIDPVRERWEGSHPIPIALCGADDDSNRRPAHYRCHRVETAEQDQPRIAKAVRQEARNIGAKRSSRPMAGSRNSPWKRKLDGEY